MWWYLISLLNPYCSGIPGRDRSCWEPSPSRRFLRTRNGTGPKTWNEPRSHRSSVHWMVTIRKIQFSAKKGGQFFIMTGNGRLYQYVIISHLSYWVNLSQPFLDELPVGFQREASCGSPPEVRQKRCCWPADQMGCALWKSLGRRCTDASRVSKRCGRVFWAPAALEFT